MSRFWLGFGDLQIGNWWKMSRSWFVFLESFKDATGGSLRSELTSGVGWTKLLRFGLGFGRFQIGGFVPHVESSSRQGDKGWVEPVHCL